MATKHKSVGYFIRTFAIVVGLVLVWRGVWHLLDIIDVIVFNGELVWTALGGIVLGILVLYLPDHDLKEIEKL
jgi:hypothetical protein